MYFVVSTYIGNIHRDKHIWTIKTFLHGLSVQLKPKGSFSKLYSSRGLKSSNDGVQFKRNRNIVPPYRKKNFKKKHLKSIFSSFPIVRKCKARIWKQNVKISVWFQKVPIFFRIFLKSFLCVCHNPKVSECIESVLTNRFYGPFD